MSFLSQKGSSVEKGSVKNSKIKNELKNVWPNIFNKMLKIKQFSLTKRIYLFENLNIILF